MTGAYRELGDFLRQRGAQKVILLSAKEKGKGREFQIVVEGSCNVKQLEEEIKDRWPDDQMTLINREEVETLDELREIEEDGIVL